MPSGHSRQQLQGAPFTELRDKPKVTYLVEQVLHTPSTSRTLVLFILGFLERFHLNKELHSFKKYLKAQESELHGLRVPQGSCQGTKQTPSLRRNVKKETQGDRPLTGTAALG